MPARVFRGERDAVTVKPIIEIGANSLVIMGDSDEYGRVLENHHDPSKAQCTLIVKHSYTRKELVERDTATMKVKVHG